MCLRDISLSTHGVIFMGTPELDSRLSGLQAFLESNATAETESSGAQKEARWMLDTLQQYSAIGSKFKTLYAYESLNSRSQVRQPYFIEFRFTNFGSWNRPLHLCPNGSLHPYWSMLLMRTWSSSSQVLTRATSRSKKVFVI